MVAVGRILMDQKRPDWEYEEQGRMGREWEERKRSELKRTDQERADRERVDREPKQIVFPTSLPIALSKEFFNRPSNRTFQ